jgi:hypothetical protein
MMVKKFIDGFVNTISWIVFTKLFDDLRNKQLSLKDTVTIMLKDTLA